MGTALILLLLLSLTALVYVGITNIRNEASRLEHELQAHELLHTTETALNNYEVLPSAAKGFFEGSEYVDEKEWEVFLEALLRGGKFPSLASVTYATYVDSGAVEAFEQEQDLEIYPENGEKDYYVIQYTEEVESMTEDPGCNLCADEFRHAAILEACDTGGIIYTRSGETFVDEGEAFIMIAPVYKGEFDLESLEGRRSAIVGIIEVRILLEDFIQTIIEESGTHGVAFEQISMVKDSQLELVFAADIQEYVGVGDIVSRQNVEEAYGEAHWDMTIAGVESTEESLMQFFANATLVLRIIITILVSMLFLSAARARARAQEMGLELTKRLSQAAERLRMATKSAHIGVWEWDVVNNILVWDKQMYEVYGVDPKNFEGAFEAWTKGLHPEDAQQAQEEVQAALKGEEQYDTTFRIVWPDESVHCIRAFANVERNEAGEAIKMTGVNWDVTQEMEIDRAKTEFVSLASHQLRTPLSAINWYVEMLLDGDAGRVTKKQRQFLEEVYASNQRMVKLVNSLLNVSRIELGTLLIQAQDLDVKKLLDEIIHELEAEITKKNIQVTKNIDPDIPNINADKNTLSMIMENLLSNAIKYTLEGGSVDVDLSQTDESLLFTVKDTGIGIPADQRDKIFTKLFRADNVHESDVEGTGLGLYLVKTILDKVGGEVSFKS